MQLIFSISLRKKIGDTIISEYFALVVRTPSRNRKTTLTEV